MATTGSSIGFVRVAFEMTKTDISNNNNSDNNEIIVRRTATNDPND
jgi:hypothetical protein